MRAHNIAARPRAQPLAIHDTNRGAAEAVAAGWFFFTSDKMPDFSQVLVNLRKAFSKDSPGRTITPVMGS